MELFDGLLFHIDLLEGDQEAGSLTTCIKAAIASHGGQVASEYHDGCTHVVLRHKQQEIYPAAIMIDQCVVSPAYVMRCLSEQKLLEESEEGVYPAMEIPGFKDIVQEVTQTDFRGLERLFVRYKCECTGAAYSGVMTVPAKTSHLVVKDLSATSEKVVKAKRHPSVHIVSIDWLDTCLKEWKYIPEDAYSLGSGVAESSEDDEGNPALCGAPEPTDTAQGEKEEGSPKPDLDPTMPIDDDMNIDDVPDDDLNEEVQDVNAKSKEATTEVGDPSFMMESNVQDMDMSQQVAHAGSVIGALASQLDITTQVQQDPPMGLSLSPSADREDAYQGIVAAVLDGGTPDVAVDEEPGEADPVDPEIVDEPNTDVQEKERAVEDANTDAVDGDSAVPDQSPAKQATEEEVAARDVHQQDSDHAHQQISDHGHQQNSDNDANDANTERSVEANAGKDGDGSNAEVDNPNDIQNETGEEDGEKDQSQSEGVRRSSRTPKRIADRYTPPPHPRTRRGGRTPRATNEAGSRRGRSRTSQRLARQRAESSEEQEPSDGSKEEEVPTKEVPKSEPRLTRARARRSHAPSRRATMGATEGPRTRGAAKRDRSQRTVEASTDTEEEPKAKAPRRSLRIRTPAKVAPPPEGSKRTVSRRKRKSATNRDAEATPAKRSRNSQARQEASEPVFRQGAQSNERRRRRRRRHAQSEPMFAFSGMGKEEKKEVTEILNELDVKMVSGTYDQKTTHVVVPSLRRNDKTMCGMAAGAWIVGSGFVKSCKEKGDLVPEVPFELETADNGAISDGAPKFWRTRCENLGTKAFAGVSAIMYGTMDGPGAETLERIITSGGGRVLKRTAPYSSLLDKGAANVALIGSDKARGDRTTKSFMSAGVTCVTTDYIVSWVAHPHADLEGHRLFGCTGSKQLKDLEAARGCSRGASEDSASF